MAETFTIDEKTGKASIVKDPNAVLDYSFNWGPWLTPIADSIASAAVVVEQGSATVQSVSNTATVVTAVVSGGTVGETCRLRCRITTVGGRVDDRSVFLKIKER